MPPRDGGRRVAVAGVGYSPVGRRTGRALESLTLAACRAALDDAGLAPEDVDGMSSYVTTNQLVSSIKTAASLGVPDLRWYMATVEGPTFLGGAIPAIAAVASGSADVCIAARSVLEAGGSYTKRPPPPVVSGDDQFTTPFGAHASPHWISLYMRRHMADFGTTEEHFAAQAIAQREFAGLNQDAFFQDPLTLEAYLSARYISKPCRLLDCDYPVDASAAVIFTTEERARSLKQKPVLVESWAMGSTSTPDSYIMADMNEAGLWNASRAMWERTDLRPSDVDVAGLYDGFIFSVFQWLEGLGFCGKGESGPFVAEGHTRLGGSLPVNCDGGAVNVGRTHGANHVIEVVRQLRGQSGARQRAGAKVGVASNSMGPSGGCLLLTAE